jgi:bacteriocin biosynthesis cyclodehydratase domain-containing protein
MVLKLDPRIPLVWRDPFSLQFGIASPVAVLRDVSTADERMVAALSSGISKSGLMMVGRASGAADPAIEKLLATVAPALLSDVETPVATILVVGTGSTANSVANDLAASGHRVLIARETRAAETQACDFAVIVAHYVVPPELHGLWLRRDIPHLAVVISDTETVVGPVIEPGSGPCLHCIQRYRTESDASWPAIATQLAIRRPPVESPLLASEAAALASRVVARRLADGEAAPAVSRVIAAGTGNVTEREWHPHPQCGCITPGGFSAEGPTRTDSPDADPRGAETPQPTTGRATSARA